MKKVRKRKKMSCHHLYHQTWFRVLLVIVGIDMFILGFMFAADMDIMALIPRMSIILHLIFGFMYMLAASFLLHYALGYYSLKKEVTFVCHHCGQVNVVRRGARKREEE